MLEQVEAGQFVQDLKMNVLQAIQYIIQSWDEVSANTIQNCWNHTKILSNIFFLDDTYEDNNSILDDELGEAIKALNLPNGMQVKELLTIPDENIVYLIPEDQIIIPEIARLFKKGSDTDHPDEIDDSTEVKTICISKALQSLKTVHTFLLQQEDTSEYIKLMGKIENFIKRKQVNSMQQTTIDKYFR